MPVMDDPATFGTTIDDPHFWTKTARTVDGLLRFNVRNPDFGSAAPGASAATNTTAFQACISAAEAAGTSAVILIPGPGTYDLNPLTITKPLRIVGAGWGTILKLAASQNDYLLKLDSSAGEIRGGYLGGFKIDGNAANQSSGGGCVNLAGAVHWDVEHMWLHAGYAAMLRLGGIAAGGQGRKNHIRHCLIDGGSSSAGEGIGALINTSDENTFFDVDFEDCGGAGGTEKGGVRDEYGLNKFIACDFVNGYEGIRVKDTGRVRIKGCTFDGCGRDSIVISGYRCVVKGNTFLEGGSKAANTYSHVHINNDSNGRNVVSGNTFTSPTAPGGNGQLRSFIRESGAAGTNLVTGNTAHIDGTIGTATGEPAASSTWRSNLGLPNNDEVSFFRQASTRWYSPPGNVTTDQYGSNGSVVMVPLVVGKTTTFDRIALEVTTAGSTGSVIRLGIYADNGAGLPGTRILDAGTVDATTTGVKELTISQQLAAGLYWLAAASQGGATTQPTVRAVGNGGLGMVGGANAPTTSAISGLSFTGYTGALPTPATTAGAGIQGAAARVLVRAA